MDARQVSSTAGWHHAMNRSAVAYAAHTVCTRLADACRAVRAEVHAYCVLPRHYHLLLRGQLPHVGAVLDHLDATDGFERKHPPHVVPVAFGRHLLSVSRYIHLNPVDAGLAWRPEDWAFTSFRAYLGEFREPPWIVTEAILGRFGAIGARHRHRAYVYAGLDPDTRDGVGRPHWPSLFIPGTLAEDLAWRIEPVLAVPVRDDGDHGVAPAGLLPGMARRIASVFGIPSAALRSPRGGGSSVAAARGALVYAARAQGGLRLRDVAAFMGYAEPASAAAAAERFARLARRPPYDAVARPASSRIM